MNQSHDPETLKHTRWYYLQWIWHQYRPYRRMVAAMLFLTVVSAFFSVLFPMVFKHILDGLTEQLKGFKNGTIDLATAVAERNRMLLLLLALGLGPMFAGVYTYLRLHMNLIFEMAFRERFFASILQKGPRFFHRFRTGDLVTRLTEDVRPWPPGLSWLCCSGIFRAVNSACLILFCIGGMLWLNVKLALVALLPLPFMMMFFIRMEGKISKMYKSLQTTVSSTNDYLEAAYSGAKIIKSFNAETPQVTRFRDLLTSRIEREMEVNSLEGLFQVFFEFLNHFGSVVVMFVGGIMVVRGQLTIGTYYAFFGYLGMIVYPLMDIPMLLVTLAQSFVTIDRLEEIEGSEQDSVPANRHSGEEIAGIDSLAFDRVGFRYPSLPTAAGQAKPEVEREPFSFGEVSFALRKGETVAVVGRIGSGKTTLLNLLAGVLNPEAGTIRVNGLPLEKINLETFRSRIGYIQQEPSVFSESVRTNIDFWRNAEPAWIEECTRLAQFEAEVKTLPEQYEERVGQRGITLSGGQRQRLSIARALVGKPDLLLMDDVTSSLDAENEQRLWQDLQQRFRGLTCLIITHRLATARRADRIMVLADGRLDALGTHEELLAANPIYQELVH